jgi:hypothetical protein
MSALKRGVSCGTTPIAFVERDGRDVYENPTQGRGVKPEKMVEDGELARP